MVAGAVFTCIHLSIHIDIFPIFAVIDSVIITVEIHIVADSIIVMIIDVGVRITILRFHFIVDSVAIVVAVFSVVNTIVVVILWICIEVVRYAVIVVIIV